MAVVHSSDGAELRLPLSEDTTVDVATDLGSNTIAVRDGAVSIVDADCPNGDCMRQVPAAQPGQQLICLPHRLWVEVQAVGTEAAGELDVDAVGWQDGSDVDVVSR